jgi:hypothetical protein
VSAELWISDCGRYWARRVGAPGDGLTYDVIEIATGIVWLGRRYHPMGWDDTDRRYTHAEFPRMVTGWLNRGRGLRSGRWVRAFALSFADCDTTVPIQVFSGNVIRCSYEATFRRMVPHNRTRQYALAEAYVDAAFMAEAERLLAMTGGGM